MIKKVILTFAFTACLLIGTASYAQEPSDGGHDGGYRWAQQKGIEDPNDCGGDSEAFIEGCQEAAVARRTFEYQQRAYEEQQAAQERQAAQREQAIEQQSADEEADSEDNEDGDKDE